MSVLYVIIFNLLLKHTKLLRICGERVDRFLLTITVVIMILGDVALVEIG